jgi:SagB-type dehydrogenase family enzyme
MTGAKADTRGKAERIELPPPVLDRPLTVEAAIRSRRSIREFDPGSITLEEISRVLWAAQGITNRAGYRTAPSAGALYPLEISLIAGDVLSLPAGIYRYDPRAHVLDAVAAGDRRVAIAEAALSQRWIADAAAILVIAAVEERTTVKYGRRGVRYVHIETGHAAQNVYLQAAALGLGTTIVGAFDDAEVIEVAGLRHEETPLCLLPIGRP